MKLTVRNPHLWHGMEDPYCCTCETILNSEAATAAPTEALAVIHTEQPVEGMNSGAAAMLKGAPVESILLMMIKSELEKILALINNYLIKVAK